MLNVWFKQLSAAQPDHVDLGVRRSSSHWRLADKARDRLLNGGSVEHSSDPVPCGRRNNMLQNLEKQAR